MIKVKPDTKDRTITVIRFILQYSFWLGLIMMTLFTYAHSMNDFQVFRYAGF